MQLTSPDGTTMPILVVSVWDIAFYIYMFEFEKCKLGFVNFHCRTHGLFQNFQYQNLLRPFSDDNNASSVIQPCVMLLLAIKFKQQQPLY